MTVRVGLLLSFFLLTTVPSMGAVAVQVDPMRHSVAHEKGGIQLAQRGRCKAFGETNKCKPRFDQRTKSCVCPGT